MAEVHAPYHFVPLSKWVYMPDWAHLVSHDVPFEDGVSGVIEYTLTNHTPLCVGDTTDENGVLKFARNPKGDLVIPGSSLKGMIRSVLEVASFGKFAAVDDKKFSYRDISSDSDYLNHVINPNEVVSGWIKFDQEGKHWQFYSCSHAKIFHKDLNTFFDGLNIANEQTAIQKYKQLPLTKPIRANVKYSKKPNGKHKAFDVGHGHIEGHCLFTNKRILGKGNKEDYEFSYLFFNKSEEKYLEDIDDMVQDLFANNRGLVTSDNLDSDLVDYLQKHQHPEHGIPVFALKRDEKIACFGFAKMPRVTYAHSIVDLINNLNPAHTAPSYFDMAELMFGTLREDAFSLKSRVIFSDACIDKQQHPNATPSPAKPTVLSSPKATFLGGYIQQNSSSHYSSYDHKNAKLNGSKRYPVRQHYEHYTPPPSKSKASQSQFELLPSNHSFKGKILFHNLKPEELSALIWTLTLNNSEYNHHTLGHAKPLGAGAISIQLEGSSFQRKNHDGSTSELIAKEECKAFSQHMESLFNSDGGWYNSVQIQQLLALTDTEISQSNHFEYMKLSDFQPVKNQKASLPILSTPHYDTDNKNTASNKRNSLAYNKGRLSELFEPNDKLLQEEKQNSSDASPLEKITSRLTSITEDQACYSSTEKKKVGNEFLSMVKELKALPSGLTQEETEILLSLTETITVAPNKLEKLSKYLSKL